MAAAPCSFLRCFETFYFLASRLPSATRLPQPVTQWLRKLRSNQAVKRCYRSHDVYVPQAQSDGKTLLLPHASIHIAFAHLMRAQDQASASPNCVEIAHEPWDAVFPSISIVSLRLWNPFILLYRSSTACSRILWVDYCNNRTVSHAGATYL